MNSQIVVGILVFAVFAVAVGSLLVKIMRHGGLKGAMFGAPIDRTVGEVTGNGERNVSIVARVHTLGGDAPERAVCLEVVATSFASYQMMPVTLSASEAQRLALLLQSAAAGRQAG
jgi:hypothetical protein